jgi:predicted enzyme related to lactoylglutathione lyase
MSDKPAVHVGPVTMYTSRKVEVVTFYRELIGLSGDLEESVVWLDAANAQVVVNQQGAPETPPEVGSQAGFVVWFGVVDVRAAHDRAKRAGCLVGDFYGDYFFARDPDGRLIGIHATEDHQHDHEH